MRRETRRAERTRMGLARGDRSLRSHLAAGVEVLPPRSEGGGPWVGAQVGPHRCPTLRPGKRDYRMQRPEPPLVILDPFGGARC
jgi:hypothetical protein